MNRIAEKLSEWFGSAPFIAFHAAWVVVWFALGLEQELLVLIMTIEGIFLLLFVLRAENVQAARTEHSVKRDVTLSQKTIKQNREIIKLLEDFHKR